jgi:hypothetical protein
MDFPKLWKKISESKSYIPTRVEIKAENTDIGDRLKDPFERHKQYFLVVVNEMYLAKGRKWFSEFQPTVIITSEFIYDGKKEAVPFVVGPSMMEGKMDVSEGFIFQDTPVAGLHPYRGGDFGISIVLAKYKSENYLNRIVGILEGMASTYMGGFGKIVNQYVTIGKIIMKGIDELLDSKDITPLAGHRKEFFSDVGNDFKPGYFALINKSEDHLDQNNFYVKKNMLYYGKSAAEALPYRENDYVLYSIMPAKKRSDFETLPFNRQFTELQNVIRDMSIIGDTERQLINAKLFSLQDTIRISPDLTRDQVSGLIEEYRLEIKTMMDDRRPLSGNAKIPEKEKDEWEAEMDRKALEILNMN